MSDDRDEPMPDPESPNVIGFLEQEKPRIKLRQEVAALLRNTGVEDTQTSVTTRANDYLAFALRSMQTKLPDARDLAGLQVAMSARLEELSLLTGALLEVATSVECSLEKQLFLGPFVADLKASPPK